MEWPARRGGEEGQPSQVEEWKDDKCGDGETMKKGGGMEGRKSGLSICGGVEEQVWRRRERGKKWNSGRKKEPSGHYVEDNNKCRNRVGKKYGGMERKSNQTIM